MLMPPSVPEDKRHQWCTQAREDIYRIIETKAPDAFFAPAAQTTGLLQLTAEQRAQFKEAHEAQLAKRRATRESLE